MSILLLMAEDDPQISRMYEKAFLANDFDARMTKDGEEALAVLLIMNPKPRVVVLDVRMPKKNGFEVIGEMKKNNDLKNIPVVFLSNPIGFNDIQKGLDMGAKLYLIKSQYSPSEVISKIKKIINEQQ